LGQEDEIPRGEYFYFQAEKRVQGFVMIKKQTANEIPLEDTNETDEYILETSLNGKMISFFWNGQRYDLHYNGNDEEFWNQVRKLVEAPQFSLMENKQLVLLDKAIERKPYRLTRMNEGAVLKEVTLQRSEESLGIDDPNADIASIIRTKLGEGN
jgi:hypothetical protein